MFKDLPQMLGFAATPLWWPLLILGIAGVLVSLTIRKLPGNGGHSPVNGFTAGAVPEPVELPGILLAAAASLVLGVVLGPEAPLIALGGGLAVCAVRLARRDVPQRAAAVVAAAGSPRGEPRPTAHAGRRARRRAARHQLRGIDRTPAV